MTKAKFTIEQMTAFKTSDGRLHEAFDDAKRTQISINRKAQVEGFFEEHGYNGMSKDGAAGIVIDNWNQFIKILEENK